MPNVRSPFPPPARQGAIKPERSLSHWNDDPMDEEPVQRTDAEKPPTSSLRKKLLRSPGPSSNKTTPRRRRLFFGRNRSCQFEANAPPTLLFNDESHSAQDSAQDSAHEYQEDRYPLRESPRPTTVVAMRRWQTGSLKEQEPPKAPSHAERPMSPIKRLKQQIQCRWGSTSPREESPIPQQSRWLAASPEEHMPKAPLRRFLSPLRKAKACLSPARGSSRGRPNRMQQRGKAIAAPVAPSRLTDHATLCACPTL